VLYHLALACAILVVIMLMPHLNALCAEHLLAQSEELAFAQLSDSDAQAIANIAQYQSWPDGSFLSEFGASLEKAPFYLLLEGNVAVQIALPDGRAPIIANVEVPGCIFGTDALFLPTRRYAQYLADGEVSCALMTASAVDALAKRQPELAYKLMTLIGATIYRNFRVNVKRLALDAAMQLNEKEQFEGELKAAQHRAKVALGINPDATSGFSSLPNQ
jgi:CRP-like cAMP-binding protein